MLGSLREGLWQTRPRILKKACVMSDTQMAWVCGGLQETTWTYVIAREDIDQSDARNAQIMQHSVKKTQRLFYLGRAAKAERAKNMKTNTKSRSGRLTGVTSAGMVRMTPRVQ